MAEKMARLLNVRLNMKLTVWPTMRLNGRLLNGRLLNGRLLNGRLDRRLLNVRLDGRLLNVRLNMKLTVWPTMRLNGRLDGKLNVGLNGRLGCLM